METWTSCEKCHTAQPLKNRVCKKCGKELRELDADNWRDLIIKSEKNSAGSTGEYQEDE